VALVRDHLAHWFGQVEWSAEFRRLPDVVLAFFEKVPAEMRAAVLTSDALTSPCPGAYRWLHDWLHRAIFLECRIPPGMTEEAMAELLAVYMEKPPRFDPYLHAVCASCGLPWPRLQRPPGVPWAYVYPLPDPPPWVPPELFECCVHCGLGQYDWSPRPDERPFAWQELAAAELGPTG